MRVVGIITTTILVAVAVVAVAVGYRSTADVQRYLKMRSM